MNTPREILLRKHESIQPQLDTVRQAVICRNVKRDTERKAVRMTPAASWFQRLLWPTPTAWAGVAAAWVVIGFLNFSTHEENGSVATAIVAQRPPEMREALREQKRLFAELINAPAEAAEPPRFIPRPRSDRQQTTFVV